MRVLACVLAVALAYLMAFWLWDLPQGDEPAGPARGLPEEPTTPVAEAAPYGPSPATTEARPGEAVPVRVDMEAETAEPVMPPPSVVLSDAVLDQAIMEQVLDGSLDLWAPSPEAIEAWVFEHRLDQIRGLSTERVLQILTPEDRELFADYVARLERGEPFGSFIAWPDRSEVDRLWADVAYREAFRDALAAMNRTALVEMWSIHAEGNKEFVEAAIQRRCVLLEEEMEAWSRLWATDTAYPHWRFLMRVADRYFE